MSKIEVLLDPEKREEHITFLQKLDGINLEEDVNSAYCPISITSTPEEVKPFITERQKILMEILNSAGITAYDPASAPYSPDVNLTSLPQEIYSIDCSKVVSSRYFVGHILLPSTGLGIESEIAVRYNRIPVMFMDNNIRVSRMQPPRTIYLSYDNFEEKSAKLVQVFEMLNLFNPGLGFHNNVPVLLGFEKNGNRIVDLEEEVYINFPELQYKFNGEVPIIKLKAENPELFYEFKQ